MKLKGLAAAIPLAFVIVSLGSGGVYGYNLQKECEARGGLFVKVRGHFQKQCIIPERRNTAK